MAAVVIGAVEKKDADNDKDDRPHQKGPVFKTGEEEDHKIV